jgi:predicted ArsR family transcriptional regulator
MRRARSFVNIKHYKVEKGLRCSRDGVVDQPLEPASLRTRERILALLLHAPAPLSVPALAAQIGISRNAAHQHVCALERDGLVERATQISTRGRPSQGFRLSDAGTARFPRQYSLLARKVIEELRRHLGPDALPAAMARMGADLAGELAPRLAGGTDRLPSIAAMMGDLGYEAHLSPDDAGEIEAHNCVFHDLAMRDPAICAVDLALLETLSGGSVEHRTCMARGERSCRFGFGRPEGQPPA